MRGGFFIGYVKLLHPCQMTKVIKVIGNYILRSPDNHSGHSGIVHSEQVDVFIYIRLIHRHVINDPQRYIYGSTVGHYTDSLIHNAYR